MPHNERLEFVGDAVLNCVIALELYERFPQAARRRSVARAREPRQSRHAGACSRAGSGWATRYAWARASRGAVEATARRFSPMRSKRCSARCFLDARLRRRARDRNARVCRAAARGRPGDARQGSQDAAAGMAAGAQAPVPEYAVAETTRRGARAAVHRRLPHPGAVGDDIAAAERAGAPPSRMRRRRRSTAVAAGARGMSLTRRSLRSRRDRRAAVGRQVDAPQRARRRQGSASRRRSRRRREPGSPALLTEPGRQFAFVDTPGFQTRHRSRLNDRLNRTVRESLASVDAVVWVVDAARLTRGRSRGRRAAAARRPRHRRRQQDRRAARQVGAAAAPRGDLGTAPVRGDRSDLGGARHATGAAQGRDRKGVAAFAAALSGRRSHRSRRAVSRRRVRARKDLPPAGRRGAVRDGGRGRPVRAARRSTAHLRDGVRRTRKASARSCSAPQASE